MGFFDRLFRKMPETEREKPIPRGTVTVYKTQLNDTTIKAMQKKYIAFDVETTGLHPNRDRIVEVGAVLFEQGQAVKRYGSMIDPGIPISPSATAVNHITNEMLAAAPREKVIYPVLMEFLGDALEGETILCAHNAAFDMAFLSETLMRLGYSGKLFYADTLALSRKLVKGLPHYKQEDVAAYFGIVNEQAHRAMSDAETCGKILWELLQCAEEEIAAQERYFEESRPNEEEMEVCAYIQDVIAKTDRDIELLHFTKYQKGYVSAYYLYEILRFRFLKKGKYIVIKKEDLPEGMNWTEPCNKAEGGEDNVRVFFHSPFELEPLQDCILKSYQRCKDDAWYCFGMNRPPYHTALEMAEESHRLSSAEIGRLLNSARKREEERIQQEKEQVEREEALQLEKQRKALEKQKKTEEKKAAAKLPKRPIGKPVLQLTDEMEVIQRFESISEASKAAGVSTKCIRDTAAGKQKHAGGYIWKFEEEEK